MTTATLTKSAQPSTAVNYECDFCFANATHIAQLGHTQGWYLCENHKAEYAWATVVA